MSEDFLGEEAWGLEVIHDDDIVGLGSIGLDQHSWKKCRSRGDGYSWRRRRFKKISSTRFQSLRFKICFKVYVFGLIFCSGISSFLVRKFSKKILFSFKWVYSAWIMMFRFICVPFVLFPWTSLCDKCAI